MKYVRGPWWLVLASVKFVIGVWLSRRPDVVDKLLRIADRALAWKRGSKC